MGDFKTKKIVLPSGKTVEIVYLNAQPNDPNQQQGAELRAENPAICPDCSSALVQPIDWTDVDAYWVIRRRCPECEWTDTRLFSNEVAAKYDDLLNRGFDQLIDSLEALARENMKGWIERFVFAVEHDGIVPFDF